MKTLRRLCYATLGVAYTHLVFGAIVRISGSGMGCGDNWPKCYGHWFPPFDRPQLVIEWSHRLLASLLILSIVGLTTAAILKRREPGVSGRGGVLRPVLSAVVVVFITAGFGAVTVFFGNPTWATVVHWTLAMTLLAVVTTAAIRAGALGGATASSAQVAGVTARGAYAAAAMAFAAVVMGGLTAKFPFGSVACQSFPGCGRNIAAPAGAVWVQLTHRTIAILLVLHLLGMVFAGRRRSNAAAIKRAILVAASLGVTQIVIAAAMVLFRLPAPLRSLHEAVGVAIWLSTFTLAYLARLASRSEPAGGADRASLTPRTPTPAIDRLPATANVRASARGALARGTEVQPGSDLADAESTLIIEATGATTELPAPGRQAGHRRDVVGHSFPTAVVGEVELIDVEKLASDAPLSADAVGTAALIAAVERADARTTPAVGSLTVNPESTAAELSLVAEALAALDSGDGPVDRSDDPSVELTTAPPTDAHPVEAAAREAADAIVDALEALHLAALGHEDLTGDDELEITAEAIEEGVSAAAANPDATLVIAPAVDLAPAADAAVVAPAETMSVAAEVQEQAAELPPTEKKPPHTMAVIVARGADL